MGAPDAARDVVLAFDTSRPTGSVALAREGRVLAAVALERRAEHAARLVPAIAELLSEHGIDRRWLGEVVVGEGPGSFTGVRIAGATAKGLSRALAIPLRPVSSLAGAALAASDGPVRYVLVDARGERVYGACYGVGRSVVQTLVEPHAGDLRDVLASDVPAGAIFLGDGAHRHRAAIEGAGYGVAAADAAGSIAEGLLRYVSLQPDVARVAAGSGWEPRYLRPSRAIPS